MVVTKQRKRIFKSINLGRLWFPWLVMVWYQLNQFNLPKISKRNPKSLFQLNSNSSVLSASGPGGASYTVRTVEGAGTARARTTLSGLQKHTAYAVVVQAYNSRGAGPASPPTTATTMEDGKIISKLKSNFKYSHEEKPITNLTKETQSWQSVLSIG